MYLDTALLSMDNSSVINSTASSGAGHVLRTTEASFNNIKLHRTTIDASSQMGGSLYSLGSSPATLTTDIGYSSLQLTSSFNIITASNNPATTIAIGNGAHALYDKSNSDLSSWSVQVNAIAAATIDVTRCKSVWHNADCQSIENPEDLIADPEQCHDFASFRWMHNSRSAVCVCSPGTHRTNNEALVFGQWSSSEGFECEGPSCTTKVSKKSDTSQYIH
jgi:hypothetical protein